MIKVDHIQVYNFEGAIRGMRNPLQSWSKIDSHMGCPANAKGCEECGFYRGDCGWTERYMVGKKDLDLMNQLYKAGNEHRKYLRQIFVSCDVTAPLYWWKEADQFKVGTVTDSESTMHCIHKRPFTVYDFSTDKLSYRGVQEIQSIVDYLNVQRSEYIRTNDKNKWWEIIQLLPSSYNQKRTWTLNYEVASAIIRQRRNHKLDEWVELCEIFLRELPYLREIMGMEDKNYDAQSI